MKKRYLNIVVFALFVSMLWGCSDWTKPEAEDFFEMPGNDYYENLRAYKGSEHSV
ncbi:endoglycosidase, partial [Bacteroides fragilis]